MPTRAYHAEDADLSLLRTRQIAVLGYGSQGRAHALNLRESGCQVLVAQRPGSGNHSIAVADRFRPVTVSEAAKAADLLIFALPDAAMGDIYAAEIAPHVRKGQTLGFLHGFSVHFGRIVPPGDVDVIMVAPKGPGSLLRERYLEGRGLPCLVAVHQDATGRAEEVALAWGAAIGCARGGMIETTFAIECETDLFGEQSVLCGGVVELMKAAYETLVEAGYPAEAAYFECIHEVKQIVDLVYTDGLAAMRRRISGTAAYGGLTRGPRLVTEGTRKEMRAILVEIRSGRFAEEWVAECRNGMQRLGALANNEAGHPCEAAGRFVRGLGCGPEPGRLD
jgi:ketol-acid reductoisomerase